MIWLKKNVDNRTVINLCGAPEKARYVLLKHGQRGVQVFQHTDDSVLTFHRVLGSLQSTDRIEWPIDRTC